MWEEWIKFLWIWKDDVNIYSRNSIICLLKKENAIEIEWIFVLIGYKYN